jgi:hypothetical protein
MRRSLLWAGVFALVGFGCGGGGGGHCTASTDLSGLWTGTVTHDDVARSSPGTVSASITQDGCTLGGTWTFTFQDVFLDKTLIITGDAPQAPETSAVAMKLNECELGLAGSCETQSPCTFVVTGTLVGSTEISGTYATDDHCSESEAGSFDIAFQAHLTPTPAPPTIALPTPLPATPTPAPAP